MPPVLNPLKTLQDVVLTLAYWLYFTLGFVVFFSPFYLAAFVLKRRPEAAFQRLNHRFYRGFFAWMRRITPGLSFDIGDDVRRIRSSVIVSNHVSYLDPILLISLYPLQKTIVKSTFFRVPLFGWILKTSGYIPSTTGGAFDGMMIRQIEGLRDYLASGGNLFIFPEGTRSRDGRIGRFSKGAFKIARQCGAPVAVLTIRHTDRLFRPGRFLFNTTAPPTITIRLPAAVMPDYESNDFSIGRLMAEVRGYMESGARDPAE